MSNTILRFVHISDTHISTDSDYGRGQHGAQHSANEGAKALVEAVNALPFTPDFVLHTGDVAYDPDPSAYQTAREILSQLKYPVYYVAGNHDYPAELQRVLTGTTEPKAPFYYEQEINGVQMIVLDSNGPAEPPRGYIHEEQLAWLEALCAAPDDRSLLVAVHHNALPVGISWLDDFMRITNGEALHQALLPARDRIRGVFSGHVHQHLDMYRDGILYSSTASSWCQFHAWPGQAETIPDTDAGIGFSIVTLTPAQTYIRRCALRL